MERRSRELLDDLLQPRVHPAHLAQFAAQAIDLRHEEGADILPVRSGLAARLEKGPESVQERHAPAAPSRQELEGLARIDPGRRAAGRERGGASRGGLLHVFTSRVVGLRPRRNGVRRTAPGRGPARDGIHGGR